MGSRQASKIRNRRTRRRAKVKGIKQQVQMEELAVSLMAKTRGKPPNEVRRRSPSQKKLDKRKIRLWPNTLKMKARRALQALPRSSPSPARRSQKMMQTRTSSQKDKSGSSRRYSRTSRGARRARR